MERTKVRYLVMSLRKGKTKWREHKSLLTMADAELWLDSMRRMYPSSLWHIVERTTTELVEDRVVAGDDLEVFAQG